MSGMDTHPHDTETATPVAVEFGVKGAVRITVREYATLAEAEAKAARWRASNSTGDYWAEVSA